MTNARLASVKSSSLIYFCGTTVLLLLILFGEITCHFQIKIRNTNASNLGIVFPPYFKAKNSNSRSEWDETFAYTESDTKDLLVQTSRLGFRRILTHQMVFPIVNGSESIASNEWSHITALMGVSAATVNSQHGTALLEVSYGITLDSSSPMDHLRNLVDESVSIAKKANAIYSNTVTSILVQSTQFYCCDRKSCKEDSPNCYPELSVQLHSNLAEIVHNGSLKYGIRTEDCAWFFRSYQDYGYAREFADIWSKIDTLVCLYYPLRFNRMPWQGSTLNEYAKKTALKYCENLSKWRQILRGEGNSKHVLLQGETGWLSKEIRGVEGINLESSEIFWTALSNCSSQKKFQINILNIMEELKIDKNTPGDNTDDTLESNTQLPQLVTRNPFWNLSELLLNSIDEEPVQETEFSTKESSVDQGPITESTKTINNASSQPENETYHSFDILSLLGVLSVLFCLLIGGFFSVCFVKRSKLRKDKFNASQFTKKITNNEKASSISSRETCENYVPNFANTTIIDSAVAFSDYQQLAPVTHEFDGNVNFNFYIGEKIDSGNYATVYSGFINTESKAHKVAWKVSNIQNADNEVLLKELKTLTLPTLQHDNICQMLMHVNITGFLAIALQFCENGSMRHELDTLRSGEYQFIDECKEPYEPEVKTSLIELLPRLLRWCEEITCGMEHLEKLSVVHADLSAKNLLLDENDTVKVSDFGLSCRTYTKLTSQEPGKFEVAWPWAAYESLTRREFSSKSDVWSFGMTLVEIFSIGNHPVPAAFNWQNFVAILESGWRPESPHLLKCIGDTEM